MDTTFMFPDRMKHPNQSYGSHSNVISMDTRTLQDTEFYAESFIQNGILICGIIFNAINLHILRKINLGENYRICLLALTTSDMLACIFGSIQLTVEGIFFRSIIPFGYWHNEAYVVYLLYYVFLTFMCTSAAYVILIAIIRTYTLRQPMKAIGAFTPKSLKRACLGILLTTIVLFLPTSLFGVWQNCFKNTAHPKCQPFFERFPNAENLKYYFYFMSLIFGPFVIITNIVCLIVMKRSLKEGRHTASERFNRRPTSIYKMIKRHSKITRTLAVILVLDTVWIIPTCIQYLGLVLSPEDTIFKSSDPGFKLYDLLAEILLAIRPTYTIFVFLVTNNDFRRKFRQMFCCCYDDVNSASTSADMIVTPSQGRRKSSDTIISPHHAILRTKNRDVTKTGAQENGVKRVKKQISWHPDKIERNAFQESSQSDVEINTEKDVTVGELNYENDVTVRNDENDVRVRNDGNDVNVRNGENDASVRNGENDVSVRNGENDASVRNGANDVRVRNDENDASVRNCANDVSVRNGENDVSVRNGENDVNVRNGQNDVNVRNGQNDVSVRNGANDVSVRNGENDVSVRKSVNDVSVRNGENDVSVRNGVNDVSVRNGENDVTAQKDAQLLHLNSVHVEL